MSTQNQATRTEKDTMGNVEVPADAYWGAQTQRSRENFKIGGETLPRPMIEAMALVKKAAAITNASLERIEGDKRDLIVQAADEIINGGLTDQFPLAEGCHRFVVRQIHAVELHCGRPLLRLAARHTHDLVTITHQALANGLADSLAGSSDQHLLHCFHESSFLCTPCVPAP